MIRYTTDSNNVFDKIIPEESKLTGEKAEEFKKILLEFLGSMKSDTLIIDFIHVEAIDSVVISALIEVRKQMKEDNFFLTEVHPNVYKLLQAISLDKVINISPQAFVPSDEVSEDKVTPVPELTEDWDDAEILLGDYEETWEELEEIIKYLQRDSASLEISEDIDVLDQIFEMEDDILEDF